MTRLITVLAVILAVVVVITLLLLTNRGFNLAHYEHLKSPAITRMGEQKMLVVEARGDPNIVGKDAFQFLLNTYFRMAGVPKGRGVPAPRARWPVDFDTPKSEWVGLYGMPVPAGVTQIPDVKNGKGLKVYLTTWEYGQVAEILHVGPYDKEESSIAALMDFIEQRNYEIVGPHEEEYLKGPGRFFKGNPEEYATMIRYCVKKPEQGGATPSSRPLISE